MHRLTQKPNLTIHPTPFKLSHLSIPPSPFSPRTPLPLSSDPPPPSHRSRTLPAADTRVIQPPPPSPLKWLWQCHQCRRTYSLGVTRRCLEDGHAFCAGTMTVKTWRRGRRPARVKRHRACASEFDYQGWKAWGRWRRSNTVSGSCEGYTIPCSSPGSSSSDSSSSSEDLFDSSSSSSSDSDSEEKQKEEDTKPCRPPQKDCWNTCDYPSQCRWATRFGIRTPMEQPVAQLCVTASSEMPPPPTSTTSTPTPTPSTEDVLKQLEAHNEQVDKSKKKTPEKTVHLWDTLLTSAKARRKSVVSPSPSPSPLASVASMPAEQSFEPQLPESETETNLQIDADGDTIMGDGDQDIPAAAMIPSLPVAASPPPPTSNSPVTTLKQMMRKGMKRTRSSRKLAHSPSKAEKEDEAKSSMDIYKQALEELPLLERVRSRDSGYGSSMSEMVDVGGAPF